MVAKSDILNASILIVDDQEVNVSLLEECCVAVSTPMARSQHFR